MNTTRPARSPRRSCSRWAAPASMATWASWPQACMAPSTCWRSRGRCPRASAARPCRPGAAPSDRARRRRAWRRRSVEVVPGGDRQRQAVERLEHGGLGLGELEAELGVPVDPAAQGDGVVEQPPGLQRHTFEDVHIGHARTLERRVDARRPPPEAHPRRRGQEPRRGHHDAGAPHRRHRPGPPARAPGDAIGTEGAHARGHGARRGRGRPGPPLRAPWPPPAGPAARVRPRRRVVRGRRRVARPAGRTIAAGAGAWWRRSTTGWPRRTPSRSPATTATPPCAGWPTTPPSWASIPPVSRWAASPAGANLAALLCLMARDRGGPAICFQWLDVPATDLTMTQPSVDRLGTGYGLDQARHGATTRRLPAANTTRRTPGHHRSSPRTCRGCRRP